MNHKRVSNMGMTPGGRAVGVTTTGRRSDGGSVIVNPAVGDRRDSTGAPTFLLTDPSDNVVIVVRDIPAGTLVEDGVTTSHAHRLGQKIARTAIPEGEPVLRYGSSIGIATVDITPGELVHVHNVASTYLRATTHRGDQP